MRRLALILSILLSLAACGRGGEEAAAPGADADVLALGQQVYSSYCIACHQEKGQGIANMYPPLTETAWTTGDKGRLIRLTLNGMQGEIEVLGETYNNIMTAHGHLSDDQIAAVLTYVRTSFGNKASVVTPDEVAAVRAATDKQGLWNAAELEGLTGMP